MIRVSVLGNEALENRNALWFLTKEMVGKKNFLIDSAAGGAKETKAANQAILPLRGKIKNVCSLELADAIKSDIIKDILTCLGCGVGEHFNINNLRYKRIIFMADSDPKLYWE